MVVKVCEEKVLRQCRQRFAVDIGKRAFPGEDDERMAALLEAGLVDELQLAIAPLFGPLIRDLQPIHVLGLGFQAVFIASLPRMPFP